MTTADAGVTTAPRPPGSVLAHMQFALAGVYATAIGVALARAASFSGHLYLPHQGDEATGTADLWPGYWAPVSLMLIVVIGVAPVVATMTALVAVARLVTARARTGYAHQRSLLVSTVFAVLVVMSWMTPFVETLHAWLLD
ncbi:hypothetical protein [Micromonospora sp. DT47]|uniref:hypothetical protein n=1 Tax=Micromonospora sp. DT47 TaxID=3393431 RepID=UPI003CFB2A73